MTSVNEDEPTNLSKEEKQIVCQILCEHGLPVTAEGKDDFFWIKDEMLRRMKPADVVMKATENDESKAEEKDAKSDGKEKQDDLKD